TSKDSIEDAHTKSGALLRSRRVADACCGARTAPHVAMVHEHVDQRDSVGHFRVLSYGAFLSARSRARRAEYWYTAFRTSFANSIPTSTSSRPTFAYSRDSMCGEKAAHTACEEGGEAAKRLYGLTSASGPVTVLPITPAREKKATDLF